MGETQRDQRRYELTKMLMQACEELDIEKVLQQEIQHRDREKDPSGWFSMATEWLHMYQQSAAWHSNVDDDAKGLVRKVRVYACACVCACVPNPT